MWNHRPTGIQLATGMRPLDQVPKRAYRACKSQSANEGVGFLLRIMGDLKEKLKLKVRNDIDKAYIAEEKERILAEGRQSIKGSSGALTGRQGGRACKSSVLDGIQRALEVKRWQISPDLHFGLCSPLH